MRNASLKVKQNWRSLGRSQRRSGLRVRRSARMIVSQQPRKAGVSIMIMTLIITLKE